MSGAPPQHPRIANHVSFPLRALRLGRWYRTRDRPNPRLQEDGVVTPGVSQGIRKGPVKGRDFGDQYCQQMLASARTFTRGGSVSTELHASMRALSK
jgi:hypothetical protein